MSSSFKMPLPAQPESIISTFSIVATPLFTASPAAKSMASCEKPIYLKRIYLLRIASVTVLFGAPSSFNSFLILSSVSSLSIRLSAIFSADVLFSL